MMEIYSVESRKGGVGKTTIALNLAKALVKKKYDVLLIDCDITGTPITNAAAHSAFWKNDVVVALNNGTPYNLIDFYDKSFLQGETEEGAIIAGLEYNQRKIHLIGSEIYDSNGELIIDPRYLMDDIHSYWFLDFLKSIIKQFCDETQQADKAIVLDNSPGYVGIGRSVREWLTGNDIANAKFVLVSSLDEQDVDSTILSAAEIARMKGIRSNWGNTIKIVINKVPEDLLTEGSGYEFKALEKPELREMVEELFPLDKNRYPKNIIKYDTAISGQFIEANLIPAKKNSEEGSDLDGALRTLEKKVYSYESKQNPYSDIGSIDYYYRKFLNELRNSGYVRMSKSLRGDLLPNSRLKNLTDAVGRLGNMAHPEAKFHNFSREELKAAGLDQLYRFIEDRELHEYSPVLVSLYHGIYKSAGFERNEANIFQMFNLNMMLTAFYAYQEEFYHRGDNYRMFLKDEITNKSVRKFTNNLFRSNEIMVTNRAVISLDGYISSLISNHFSKFYQGMNTAILGMIDCRSDYELVINACKDTIRQGGKMLSEDLLKYLKDVVARKTEEPNEADYKRLATEPYEMKAIQKMMREHVL